MKETIRIYRMIDKVMTYSSDGANKDLPYKLVKEAVISYCRNHPCRLSRTHVGNDDAARQIASNLSGVKIW